MYLPFSQVCCVSSNSLSTFLQYCTRFTSCNDAITHGAQARSRPPRTRPPLLPPHAVLRVHQPPRPPVACLACPLFRILFSLILAYITCRDSICISWRESAIIALAYNVQSMPALTLALALALSLTHLLPLVSSRLVVSVLLFSAPQIWRACRRWPSSTGSETRRRRSTRRRRRDEQRAEPVRSVRLHYA